MRPKLRYVVPLVAVILVMATVAAAWMNGSGEEQTHHGVHSTMLFDFRKTQERDTTITTGLPEGWLKEAKSVEVASFVSIAEHAVFRSTAKGSVDCRIVILINSIEWYVHHVGLEVNSPSAQEWQGDPDKVVGKRLEMSLPQGKDQDVTHLIDKSGPNSFEQTVSCKNRVQKAGETFVLVTHGPVAVRVTS